jgi:hypothetical protein
LQEPSQFRSDRRKIGFPRAGPGDQHQIPEGRLAEAGPVEIRLDPPAKAIADDGVADVLGNRDPDAGSAARFGGEEDEKRPGLPLAPTLDS